MMKEGSQQDFSPDGLLTQIEREHLAERSLCDVLELIADDLLGPLDLTLTRRSVTGLRRCVKRHRILEEGYFYPVLTNRLRRGELDADLLEQIRGEHASDQSLAYDTADQLERALARGRAENPEMLGYMLHGFFECRRRHIAWEDAVVLPLAKSRFSPEDYRAFSVEEFEQTLGLER